MKHGDSKSIVKMCVKCHRLVSLDALVCTNCGGILFLTVNLDNPSKEK